MCVDTIVTKNYLNELILVKSESNIKLFMYGFTPTWAK